MERFKLPTVLDSSNSPELSASLRYSEGQYTLYVVDAAVLRYSIEAAVTQHSLTNGQGFIPTRVHLNETNIIVTGYHPESRMILIQGFTYNREETSKIQAVNIEFFVDKQYLLTVADENNVYLIETIREKYLSLTEQKKHKPSLITWGTKQDGGIAYLVKKKNDLYVLILPYRDDGEGDKFFVKINPTVTKLNVNFIAVSKDFTSKTYKRVILGMEGMIAKDRIVL